MKKQELIEAIVSHPKFEKKNRNTLSKLTNKELFSYLCELEEWKPLEVRTSDLSEQGWYLVASQSNIGDWYHTNLFQRACSCQHREYTTILDCCHLEALAKHEETRWIAEAKKRGFDVRLYQSKYAFNDINTGVDIGVVYFCDFKQKWVLRERGDVSEWSGIDEIIEYLSCIASFGYQARL